MERILVLEDDPDILEAVGLILNGEGYQTILLNNGRNIFKEIEASHPDLIILDVMLSGMDGRVICNDIQARGLRIPVIIVSATEKADALTAFNCKPNDFIEKPFEISTLLRTVKAALAA
jgi:DNA-binding response OmpR family regulator